MVIALEYTLRLLTQHNESQNLTVTIKYKYVNCVRVENVTFMELLSYSFKPFAFKPSIV